MEAILPKPLFPENDEPLFIKQGDYGDCFVLAGFESIYNSGEEGRKALSSIFSYSPYGLTVRLRNNLHSVHLKPDDFICKYKYQRLGGEDVFTVYWHTLDEIASFTRGVKTNAFALKVLERIISNYFAFAWNRRERRGSLGAYNYNEKERHPKKSSQDFLAELLGIKAVNLGLSSAIRLKKLAPRLPVFVSMQYGSAPQAGRRRFHALIIDTVFPGDETPEKYTLSLINPWNNQLREDHSSEATAIQKANYSVFITAREAHQELVYIANNPTLFELVCQAKSDPPITLLPNLVGVLCRLYREMTYLPELINSLTASERRRLYVHIALTSELKEGFIEHVLYTFGHTRAVEIIIQHEPQCSRGTYDILANIALNEKNSTIYNYLVKNNFDFPLFLQTYYEQKGKFVKAILHLEEQFYPPGGVAKLRRITSYIEHLGEEQEFKRSFSKESIMLAPFIDQATKKQFMLLRAREALRIIYYHADTISKFQFSFAQCASTNESDLHYKKLLSQVESMEKHPDLMEASRAILVKDMQADPKIVSATTKIRAEIKAAKLAQDGGLPIKSKNHSHGLTRVRFFPYPKSVHEASRPGTIANFHSSFV